MPEPTCEHEFEYREAEDLVRCKKCLRLWQRFVVSIPTPFEISTASVTGTDGNQYCAWYTTSGTIEQDEW